MQDNKWSPSQDPPHGYMALSNTNYPSYRDPAAVATAGAAGAPPQPQPQPPTIPQPPHTGEGSIHGLMSMTQPATPQPESVSLPPTPLGDKSPQSTTSGGGGPGAGVANATPGAGAVRPMIPTRPASFSGTTTTTNAFSSHPYPDYVNRKRRTESIFSFEMGPTFSSTKQLEELYSLDQSNRYQIQLHAKMDRGFFRAEQDWACYRRNYFQVSSTFDVHGVNYMLQGSEVPCLLRTSQNEILQIEYFSIGVSARVTGNPDKKIELVQHTPKRDKGPQMIPKPQAIRAGGNLHLASVGSNHHIATFERMQFKTATANNGKRRAAQQYYEIVIELYGNTAQGQEICVATCYSAPLVVRGRSPGHYADSHTRYRHSSVASSSSATSSQHPPPPPPPPLQLPTSPPVNDLTPYYYDYSSPHPPHHSPYPPPPTSSASDSYFQRPENKISMPPPPPVMSTDPAYYESAQPAATAPGFYSRHPEAKDPSFSTTTPYNAYGTTAHPPPPPPPSAATAPPPPHHHQHHPSQSSHPYDDYSGSYSSSLQQQQQQQQQQH